MKENIKKYWVAYLTCLNTLLCILVICWCIIIPSTSEWQDVYLIRTTAGYEYVSEDGYSAIKVKKQGEYITIRYYYTNGEVRETTTYRNSVLYIDYV